MEEVRAAARAYRVYFKKDASEGDGDDYLVDHTSLIVMGPDGAYVTHFTFGTPPDEIAAQLSGLLG
ncbi:MAG: SCO family protein [Alphaproteobacteria bacterium]|nr:SCO family protein [Alphaproteobacteria bacterium]